MADKKTLPIYQIEGWDKRYENHSTRRVKTVKSVPVKNSHNSDGYTYIMSLENGVTVLGAWLLILEVASKCKKRGILIRENGEPHTAESIARMTLCPVKIVEQAISILCSHEVGWLEVIDNQQEAKTCTPCTHLAHTLHTPRTHHGVHVSENIAENMALDSLSSDDDNSGKSIDSQDVTTENADDTPEDGWDAPVYVEERAEIKKEKQEKERKKRKVYKEKKEREKNKEKELEKEKEKEASFRRFEEAWRIYGRYGVKKTSLRYWRKISKQDQQAILTAIPEYLKCVSAGRAKSQFEGWINPRNRKWDVDWSECLRSLMAKNRPPLVNSYRAKVADPTMQGAF